MPDRAALTYEQKLAMEDAFLEWQSANDHALSLGGTGDVSALWAALSAASAKGCKPSQ